MVIRARLRLPSIMTNVTNGTHILRLMKLKTKDKENAVYLSQLDIEALNKKITIEIEPVDVGQRSGQQEVLMEVDANAEPESSQNDFRKSRPKRARPPVESTEAKAADKPPPKKSESLCAIFQLNLLN